MLEACVWGWRVGGKVLLMAPPASNDAIDHQLLATIILVIVFISVEALQT